MAKAPELQDIDYGTKDNASASYPEGYLTDSDANQLKTKGNASFNLVRRTLYPPRKTITTSTYDVLASDVGYVLYVNVNCVITLPDVQGDVDSNAIADYTNLTVICGQNGINVDFETSAPNAIVAKDDNLRLTGRGAAATCYYAAINNFWNVFGDLVENTDSGSGSSSSSSS